MVTKGHPLTNFAIFLSVIVVVLSLRYLVDMDNKHPHHSSLLYQAGSFMVGPALQFGYRVFAIRIDKTVFYVYLTYYAKKRTLPVFTRLTTTLLLRAVGSVRQQKTAKFGKSVEFAQKCIHLISSLLYCASSTRNRLSNTGGSESGVSRVLGVATLKDITGSKEGCRMNNTNFANISIKRLKDMSKFHILASILPFDIIVFQVVQLVMETTTRFSAPASSLASSRAAAEDIWDHIDHPSSVPQAEEQLMIISSTNPAAIGDENSLPSRYQPHQQPTNIASTIGETHSTTETPLHPQRTYAPIAPVVNELLDDGISTIESLGPTEVQMPIRTLGINHGELSGDIRPSPQPSPVSHARGEPYRPIFQPLTPHIERFIQAEQPWSSELQGLIGSAREYKLQDVIDKSDEMGL